MMVCFVVLSAHVDYDLLQRSQDALASRYGDMLGSVGERYTPATPDEIAALDARLRKRGEYYS